MGCCWCLTGYGQHTVVVQRIENGWGTFNVAHRVVIGIVNGKLAGVLIERTQRSVIAKNLYDCDLVVGVFQTHFFFLHEVKKPTGMPNMRPPVLIWGAHHNPALAEEAISKRTRGESCDKEEIVNGLCNAPSYDLNKFLAGLVGRRPVGFDLSNFSEKPSVVTLPYNSTSRVLRRQRARNVFHQRNGRVFLVR
jgi:hypothetical protein